MSVFAIGANNSNTTTDHIRSDYAARRSILRTTQCVVALSLLLASVPAAAQTTIFEGGNLSDLQALSPTLTFDELIIRGDLVVNPGAAVTINANRFTLESQARIIDSQDECSYGSPPDVNLLVSGLVTLDGDIALAGKHGSRITESSSCKQCGGVRGGNFRVVSNQLRVSGSIGTSGGLGSFFVFVGIPASSCSGGAGGNIVLEAADMDLSGAFLGSGAGQDGDGGKNVSGSASLDAMSLDMEGGSISVGGQLSLTAATTSIFAPFKYGSLVDLIGGVPDTTPPSVQIISPAPDSTMTFGDVQVVVQVSDSGTGIHSVTLSGLGTQQVYSGDAFVNGRLTVTYPAAQAGMLTATARDNKALESFAAVGGLSFAGPVTIPAGQTVILADDLALGQNAVVTIDGTLVLPYGSDRRILAGSFIVGANGRIETESLGQRVDNRSLSVKAPSLIVSVTGDAVISGTIDLSGRNDEVGDGISGGDFDLFARSISVPGTILSMGDDGVLWCFGLLVRTCINAGGGDGGAVRLYSRTSLSASGVLNVGGGDSSNLVSGLGFCWDGGDGGVIELNYETSANLSGAVIEAGYGGEVGQCYNDTPRRGVAGFAELIYRGSASQPVADVVNVSETEPNANEREPQTITYLNKTRVDGGIDLSDTFDYTFNFPDGTAEGRTHELYDFYTFNFPFRDALVFQLHSPVDSALLGLIIAKPDLTIVAGQAAISEGDAVSVAFDNAGVLGGSFPPLTAGEYLLAVSREAGTPTTTYELTVTMFDLTPEPPAPVPQVPLLPGEDNDGDGIPDSLDADDDNDGMPDVFEIANGFDPLDNSDADGDADGDGYTNLVEYKRRSDPNDPNSIPKTILPFIPVLLEEN